MHLQDVTLIMQPQLGIGSSTNALLAAEEEYTPSVVTIIDEELGEPELVITGNHDCPSCCWAEAAAIKFFSNVVLIVKNAGSCSCCYPKSYQYLSIPRRRVRTVNVEHGSRDPQRNVCCGITFAIVALIFLILVCAYPSMGPGVKHLICEEDCEYYGCHDDCTRPTFIMGVAILISLVCFLWPLRNACCCRPPRHIVTVSTDDTDTWSSDKSKFTVSTKTMPEETLKHLARYAAKV